MNHFTFFKISSLTKKHGIEDLNYSAFSAGQDIEKQEFHENYIKNMLKSETLNPDECALNNCSASQYTL